MSGVSWTGRDGMVWVWCLSSRGGCWCLRQRGDGMGIEGDCYSLVGGGGGAY